MLDSCNRPQDRIRRKRERSPARVVNMRLDLGLVAALELMAEGNSRSFHNAIDMSLRWAVWAWSHGRNPDLEMLDQPGGYTGWNEKVRKQILQ